MNCKIMILRAGDSALNELYKLNNVEVLLWGLLLSVYTHSGEVSFNVKDMESGKKCRIDLSFEHGESACEISLKVQKDINKPLTEYRFYNAENGFGDFMYGHFKHDETGLSLALDRCEEDEAEGIGVLLETLARQIVKDPNMPLSKLKRVDGSNESRVLEGSQGEELVYDIGKTWIDFFREWVRECPDDMAIWAGNGTLTYALLDEASDSLAAYLLDRGVKENDFIALMTGRVKEYMIGVAGIHKAGCAFVPIDISYPQKRIDYMLEDSDAKLVLTQEIIEDAVKTKTGSINRAVPDGLAYMIYTSGSTGKPKGAMIAHRSLTNFTMSMIKNIGIRRADRVSSHRAFSFDAHIEDFFPTLCSGASVYIMPEEIRRDTSMIIDFMNKHKITGGGFTTSVGKLLINDNKLPLRYLTCGGEALNGVIAGSEMTIINKYGPTECTDNSTFFILQPGVSYNAVPIGRPLQNTECYVVDSFGKLLPLGLPGELCVSGVQVGNGYYKRKELTDSVFVKCPFHHGERMYHTGDIARYGNDRLLYYLGRKDTQVKLNGYRIELGEIEAACMQCKGVKEAVAVISQFGAAKHLVLYYTISDQTGPDENSLKAHTQSSGIAEYMYPEIYVKLDTMPRLPNGKVDRRNLPIPEFLNKIKGIKPATAMETAFLSAAREFINDTDFGVTDDLFDLGMKSLTAMRFISRINSLPFHDEYRVTDIMHYRNIRALIEGSRRIFYNYGEYDPGKPLLVFVYGIAPIAGTLKMFEIFNSKFNIFVIEATDAHYNILFKDADYVDVNDMYLAILENHLPGDHKKIDGFMGFSWGGLLSFTLASAWKDKTGQEPFVMMGDTDLNKAIERSEPEYVDISDFPENLYEMTNGAITQLEVVNKLNMADRLNCTVKSIPVYEGKVIFLSAGRTETGSVFSDPDALKVHDKKLKTLKKYAPDSHVYGFPEHTHNDLFYDSSMFGRYLELITLF